MTDFEKYKEDILTLKNFYAKEYLMTISDRQALKIIKDYEKKTPKIPPRDIFKNNPLQRRVKW